MKSIAISLIALASISLMLGACATDNSSTKTENNSTTKTETTAKAASDSHKEGEKHTEGDGHKDGEHGHKAGEKHTEGDGHNHAKDGKDEHSGQVMQNGKYHVEFKPETVKEGVHLDTVLHGENEKQITDAKLVAQVQSPDGSSKTLPVPYNAGEKQYTATFPATVAGDYKVVMQVDVKGEKFNGRFNFKK